MPQVDLETLVSACAGGGAGDNKIACEMTLAAQEDDDYSNSDPGLSEKINSDFPAESFWLSKDAEFDWFDRNAFYVRSESTKGNSNSTNLNPNLIQNTDSNSSSQRFSGTLRRSKVAVIGLPKTQKSCFVDSKNRRYCSKTAKPRLFPNRSGSVGGKSNAPVKEPSSPNVSCMGRVRSKRDRNRRFRTRQRSKSNEPAPVKPPAKLAGGRKRTGLFSSFRAIFRSGRRSESASSQHAPTRHGDSSHRKSSAAIGDIRERLPPGVIDASSTDPSLPHRSVTVSETPAAGLGGMKRFVSGRRPDSWASDGV